MLPIPQRPEPPILEGVFGLKSRTCHASLWPQLFRCWPPSVGLTFCNIKEGNFWGPFQFYRARLSARNLKFLVNSVRREGLRIGIFLAYWLASRQWTAAVWDFHEVCFVGGSASLNGHPPTGSGHLHEHFHKSLLSDGYVGWEASWTRMHGEGWKAQCSKPRAVLRGLPNALTLQALTSSSIGKTQVSDSKGMASSNNNKRELWRLLGNQFL